jgi:hypothetical protein
MSDSKVEPRLSELQRKRLWEDLLLAEARSYYFGDLATRYNREQRAITWISLILSSGATLTAVTAAVAKGQVWIPAALALIASAITLYSVVAQNPKRASDAGDLHTRWAKLARAYERLWEDMYADDALGRLNAIEDSDPELSKPAVGLPWDRKRMRRWQEHVERLHGVAAAA